MCEAAWNSARSDILQSNYSNKSIRRRFPQIEGVSLTRNSPAGCSDILSPWLQHHSPLTEQQLWADLRQLSVWGDLALTVS